MNDKIKYLVTFVVRFKFKLSICLMVRDGKISELSVYASSSDSPNYGFESRRAI